MRSHITAHAQNPPDTPSGEITLLSIDHGSLSDAVQLITANFEFNDIPVETIVWTAQPDLEWLLKKHPIFGVTHAPTPIGAKEPEISSI